MKKKSNILSIIFFFSLGLFTITSQSVILREVISFFYGNEFFIGIILVIWFLGSAIGSFLGEKISSKFFLLNILFSLLLLPSLIALSVIFRSYFFHFGEIPPLVFSLFVNSFLLFIFCFSLGSLFVLGVKFFQKKENAIGLAYLWETIGMAIGGVLFSLFLVNLPIPWERKFLSLYYPNLVEFKNTPYGKIVVNKSGSQYNFFESGGLIGTTNDSESNEYFYQTIFLIARKPKKILLIGNGLTGGLTEILKYSIEKVDYLELDPNIVLTINKYLPITLKNSLNDSRLKIHLIDGRTYLKNTQEKYDLIIFNLPNPATFVTNRFYTKEVFWKVRDRLSPTGIFVTGLSLPVDYLSREATMVGSSVFNALKGSFKNVLILPTEKVLFFTSQNKFLIDEEKIKEDWLKKKVKTYYFTPEYLFSNLKSPQGERIYSLLNTSPTITNSDFFPSAVFYQTTFWQTYFSFGLAKIQTKIAKPFSLLILSFLLLAACYLLLKKLSKENFYPIISIYLSGFTLMSFELLILFLFQTKVGYLYSRVALLMGIILGAYGLGNYFSLRKINQIIEVRKIIKFSFISLIILLVIFYLTSQKWESSFIFYAFSGLIGFFSGFIFPAAAKIYYSKSKKAGGGILYATDLFGSLFGCLFPTLFWLPILGINQTVSIILLSLFTFLILFR